MRALVRLVSLHDALCILEDRLRVVVLVVAAQKLRVQLHGRGQWGMETEIGLDIDRSPEPRLGGSTPLVLHARLREQHAAMRVHRSLWQRFWHLQKRRHDASKAALGFVRLTDRQEVLRAFQFQEVLPARTRHRVALRDG